MSVTKLYICPGIHPAALTGSFLNALAQAWGQPWDQAGDQDWSQNWSRTGDQTWDQAWGVSWSDRFILGILPPEVPPYAPRLILEHLEDCLGQGEQGDQGDQGLVWIGFSAGVVGALLAARQWHRQGHPVQGLIAIDGWGVPLWADFPVYSLSPDRFAYETTRGLRSPLPHFYADPPVSHLGLWEQPHKAIGWVEFPGGQRQRLTGAEYIRRCLCRDKDWL